MPAPGKKAERQLSFKFPNFAAPKTSVLRDQVNTLIEYKILKLNKWLPLRGKTLVY